MAISRTALLALAVSAFAAAGCQSARVGGFDSQPAPLPPAPAGTITTGQLPPPAPPTGPTDPSAFPDAPTNPDGSPGGTQVAALPPANSPEISKSGLVGSWGVNSAGSSCQMFLTLTKYGNASRGGTRGCSGDLSRMRGWDVAGSQLVIYDEAGSTIARLYSSGAERLDGQTTGGQAVSLSR